MEYSKDYKFIPMTSIKSGLGIDVTPDIHCLPIQIVNICFIGNPQETNECVLIDTGMPKSADQIISALTNRFGPDVQVKAIILTHGHFDHIGAVIELIEKWDVTVYAHELELPYLTGKISYPEPDSSVEGGLIAKISSFFPNEPINLDHHVKLLPADGIIPELPDWKWIHTPGHSPGHISLFRQKDRVLIAGDAFITVRQDSLYKVFTQQQEINGPPRYFTTDWQKAWHSVKQLANLQPSIAITGHGTPVSGESLTTGLNELAENFDQLAIPDYGRYVDKTEEN